MNPTNYRVRRATLDDLSTLRPIWESMRLRVPELEKRLTEFQVAEESTGKVVGAVGFQMLERQGLIHSEALVDFAAADAVRPLFWDRLQVLMVNHGISRVWSCEEAPFWKQHGLIPADATALKKLPPTWNDPAAQWLTLRLKDEETIVSLEKELALFMEAEKQRTARSFQQARVLKFVATILAIAFAIFVIVAVVMLLRRNPGALNPGR